MCSCVLMKPGDITAERDLDLDLDLGFLLLLLAPVQSITLASSSIGKLPCKPSSQMSPTCAIWPDRM